MEIDRGYVLAQLAKASTPEKAEKWTAVLRGMASGHLRIGSRTPVKAQPAWVTPEVLRGGFATGEPAASGPLEPWESPSRRPRRAALTEEGFEELDGLLTSGAPRPAARGGGAADRGLARRPGRPRGRAAAGGGAGAARGPAASAPHPGRARPDAGRDRLAPDGEGNDDDAGRSPAQRTRGDDARDAGGLEPVRRRAARTLAPDRGRRPRGCVLPRGLAQAGPRAPGAL